MVAKYAWRELKRLVRPHSVITLRLGKQTVEESAMAGILGILVLYVICFTIACVLMATIMGGDVPGLYQPTETAVTSVIAALGNIGPGLGAVGPTQNYAWVPDSGKWVLCFCMLLGRLEFYSVLILLVPLTWRR
jgi:trk system potassium uptake protein TrkH